MFVYTVFTRTVAAATINFSLVPVRLLFEGGSYYFPHALNDSVTPVLCSREYLFSHTTYFDEGLQ